MSIVCFDFETDLFGPRNLAPPPVCVSIATLENDPLVIASCESDFEEVIEAVLLFEMITGVKTAFDMAVILARLPRLAPLVWKAYREDRVTDVIVREKLLVLADTGDLKFANAPNGAKMKLGYSLADIEQRRLGIDRSSEKKEDDAWRTNYGALMGIPASEYPDEAFAYSRDDSVNGLAIHRLQDTQSELLRSQFLNARADLALYLNSCWGFAVDSDRVEKVFKELSEQYHEKNYPDLVRLGIIRPSVPPQPHERQLEKAVAMIGQRPDDWSPFREMLEDKGIKFKTDKASSKNEKVLRTYVEVISKRHGVKIRLTPGKQISFGEDVQVDLHGFDPIFDSFIDRMAIQKLVTTELPRMSHGRVHPKYDILKATSRTASYGTSKKDKNPPYYAVGIQQIDERVRESYIADPGRVLCSIDYDFIELVSAAQKCLDLFDHSVLAEQINAGKDPHAMLGLALVKKIDGFTGNYEDFMRLKVNDPDRFKLWRTMAKPTGLGYWGGLGAKTFIGYAKKTFGVDLIKMAGGEDGALALSEQLKATWKESLPETEAYFRWVTTECIDLEWSDAHDQRYCYASPNGTVRRNCTYCAATNGSALQTPTAEGAKIALFKLAESFYDSSLQSCLLGGHQLAFIHDEVILQFPIDDYMHERAYEAAQIMIDGMSEVMTRMKVGAAPALMFRWNKKADTVFDQNNRLTVWKPE